MQRLRERAAAEAKEERQRREEELRQAKADAERAERTREWTDITGQHTVVAEFAGLTAGTVKLKKADGSTVTLPIDQLSEADQAWIKARR